MVFTVRLILASFTVLSLCTSLEAAAIKARIPRENGNGTKENDSSSNKIERILVESTTLVPNETKTEDTTVNLIKSQTQINQSKAVNNSNVTDESRTENARSFDFDISKYLSPEFHNKNNVFNLPTSPENEKFVNSDFLNKNSKNADLGSSETYKSGYDKDDFFDKTYHNIDNETPIFKPGELNVDDLIKKSKDNNANTNLNLLKYTNVINNKNEKEKENGYHLSFDSVYNDSKVYEEKFTDSTTTIQPKKDDNLIEDKTEKVFVVAKRGSTKYVATSEKPSVPTVAQRNIAFKNNLIKNSIHEEAFITDTNEQSVQENVVYPIIVPLTTSQPMEMFEVTEQNTQSPAIITNNISNNTTPEVFYEITTEVPTTLIDTTLRADLSVPTTPSINVVDAESTTDYQNPSSLKNIVETTTKTNLIDTTTESTTTIVTTEQISTSTKDNQTEAPTQTTTIINSQPLIEERSTTEVENKSQEITTYRSDDEIPSTTPSTTEASTENHTITTINSEEYFTTTHPFKVTTTTENSSNVTGTIGIEDITTIFSNYIKEETTKPTPQIRSNSSIISALNNTTSTKISSTTTMLVANNSTPSATVMPEFKIFNKEKPLSNASIENPDIDDDNEEFGDDDYNDLQNKKTNHTNGIIDDPEIHAIDVLEPEQITPALPEVFKKPKHVPQSEVPLLNTTKFEEVSTESIQLPNPVPDDGGNATVIAIIISSVGGICLAVLVGLLIVMRRRQRRFNYGQRCTPVSLDSYSMDNVSVHNSVRRKARLRGSKRSYGNPAFDDATVSHTMSFQQLVKFVLNVDEIKAEFEEVPQVTTRMNELPEGCDTKNRYANVIPLPESRVFLNPIENDPTSDYINANYVTGPKGVKNYYIACQAPMLNTVDDFWRMIWEQQSKVIIMLTHLFENGVEKCIDYLPPSEVLDCHRLFGDFQVTLKRREVKDKYIISSLQLKNMVSNSWREVTHLWYLGWPEKGVPLEENSLIAFLIEARSFVKLVQNNSDTKPRESNSSGIINSSNSGTSPVVVHCSPGTGRTGTVIACDIAIREFELKRIVDIPKIVYRIRRDRASSVQTKDQYLFIYKIISLYATKLAGGAMDSI